MKCGNSTRVLFQSSAERCTGEKSGAQTKRSNPDRTQFDCCKLRLRGAWGIRRQTGFGWETIVGCFVFPNCADPSTIPGARTRAGMGHSDSSAVCAEEEREREPEREKEPSRSRWSRVPLVVCYRHSFAVERKFFFWLACLRGVSALGKQASKERISFQLRSCACNTQ